MNSDTTTFEDPSEDFPVPTQPPLGKKKAMAVFCALGLVGATFGGTAAAAGLSSQSPAHEVTALVRLTQAKTSTETSVAQDDATEADNGDEATDDVVEAVEEGEETSEEETEEVATFPLKLNIEHVTISFNDEDVTADDLEDDGTYEIPSEEDLVFTIEADEGYQIDESAIKLYHTSDAKKTKESKRGVVIKAEEDGTYKITVSQFKNATELSIPTIEIEDEDETETEKDEGASEHEGTTLEAEASSSDESSEGTTLDAASSDSSGLASPSVSTTKPSSANATDGSIKPTNDATYEYSTDNGQTWQSMPSEGLTNLGVGTYLIRTTDGSNTSEPLTITLEAEGGTSSTSSSTSNTGTSGTSSSSTSGSSTSDSGSSKLADTSDLAVGFLAAACAACAGIAFVFSSLRRKVAMAGALGIEPGKDNATDESSDDEMSE